MSGGKKNPEDGEPAAQAFDVEALKKPTFLPDNPVTQQRNEGYNQAVDDFIA
jgi:hypothetical protein